MAEKFYRDESKRNYAIEESQLTLNHLNAGSLQRIADATELMAKNYLALQEEAARYKRWYEGERKSRHELELQRAALKGVITKLKKAAKKEVTVGN